MKGVENVLENNEFHSEDSITWKPISLTYIEYQTGDLLGCCLAWLSLSPIILLVAFATLILFRRDLHTVCFLCGILCNEVVNWCLKHIIREQRPTNSRPLVTEYGMPSSHAQFMSFFASYMLLFLFIRVHHNVRTVDNLWKYLFCACLPLHAVIVCYSRVYLFYHTVSQVCWGALAGTILGVSWFTLVQFILTPLFPIIVSWPISEFLMLRDSTLIPNIMWFEYTSARTEARNRQRKLPPRKSLS